MDRVGVAASTRNQKIIGVIVVVVLVGRGRRVPASPRVAAPAKSGQVVVFSRVQNRTLQSTVALNGTLARKQIRNITAANQGLVSAVTSKNGSVTRAGDVMFSLGGRDAIAETGVLPFFRTLAPGDQGEDVLELKRILAASGDYPGTMNNYFSRQTQFALAQWQAQHHYPNSTPVEPRVRHGLPGAGDGLQGRRRRTRPG